GIVGTGDILMTFDSDGNRISSYQIVIYGDINGDGAIDVFDFAMVKRYILGLSDITGINAKAADCYRDGTIDVFDFSTIKRYILGLGSVRQ
ncbi:MAG: dockerin type I repeat-containing protein, partial [Lachnospira sp.]|nr:dockerin type I repeat-containing protein [Lachnospira sp.]